jgi:hypothetical protein
MQATLPHSEEFLGRVRQRFLWLFCLGLLLCVPGFTESARADTVTLTEGIVAINHNTGTISASLVGGPGFMLQSFVDLNNPQPTNSYFTCGVNCAALDGNGHVTFGNIAVSSFSGSGTFTESTITGSVTLFGNFPDLNQPPFPITINYSGTGTRSVTGNSEIFTINAPAAVPEPGTLILLGTGLFGTLAVLRLRRKTRIHDKP